MQNGFIGPEIKHLHPSGNAVLHRMPMAQGQDTNAKTLGCEMLCSQQTHFLCPTCSEVGKYDPEIIHGSAVAGPPGNHVAADQAKIARELWWPLAPRPCNAIDLAAAP